MKKLVALLVTSLCVVPAIVADSTIEVPDWQLYASQLTSALVGLTDALQSGTETLSSECSQVLSLNGTFDRDESVVASVISCVDQRFSSLQSTLDQCVSDTNTISASDQVALQLLQGQLLDLQTTTTAEINSLTAQRDAANANLANLQSIYATVTAGNENLAATFIQYATDTSNAYDAMVAQKTVLLNNVNALLARIAQHSAVEQPLLSTTKLDLCN